MRIRKKTEATLQRACLDLMQWQAPSLIVFHVPNGGGRSRIEAAILKGQGVMPGVADLVVIFPSGLAGFIELKNGDKGRLSEAQIEFQRRVAAVGSPYAVVRTLDAMKDLLTEWKAQGLLEEPSGIPVSVRHTLVVLSRRVPGKLKASWGHLITELHKHVETYNDPQFWLESDAEALEACARMVRARVTIGTNERATG